MGFSNEVKAAAGFREILRNEKFTAKFYRLEVYQLVGMRITGSALDVWRAKLDNDHVDVCIANSLNEACQKVHGDDFVDDEASWAVEHDAAPPYLMVSLGPTSDFTVSEGFVKIDDKEIHFWDCLSDVRKMLRSESDRVLPTLLTSLTVSLASAQAQPRLVFKDAAFFGTDSTGRDVKDFRVTVNIRGMALQAYTDEVIRRIVKDTLESLHHIHRRAAEFFSLAEIENDSVKKFILYFVSLEILTHHLFLSNLSALSPLELDNKAKSSASLFPYSTEWLSGRKHRQWATLQERFIATVMFASKNLDESIVKEFSQLKKLRDSFLHGSLTKLDEGQVGKLRGLLAKMFSAA